MIRLTWRWTSCLTLALALAGPLQAQWRDRALVASPGDRIDLRTVASGNYRYVYFQAKTAGEWVWEHYASRDGGRSFQDRFRVDPGWWGTWSNFHADGEVVAIISVELAESGGHGGGDQTDPDRVWVDVSRDAGQTFERTQVNTPSLFHAWGYPAIRVDGDRIWATWTEDEGVPYLQESRDRGQTWRPPIPLPIDLEHETFEVSGSTLHYLQIDEVGKPFGSEDHLVHWRSVDAGQTWTSQRIDAASPALPLSEPRLVVSGARVAAQWIERPSSNAADLWLASSQDDGATWSSPTRMNDTVPAGTERVDGADLAIDGLDFLSVHTQISLTQVELFARVSRDGGQSWAPSVRIAPVPASAGTARSRPRAAISGRRASAIWVDGVVHFPNQFLYGSVSTDGGSTWVNATRLSQREVTPFNPYDLSYDDEGAVGVVFGDDVTTQVHSSSLHQPLVSLQGTLSPGQPVSLKIDHVEPRLDGNVALMLLSGTGNGLATGGIPIPGTGGQRRLLLDADALTLLGLGPLVPVLTTAPLAGGSASTPTVTVPSSFPTGPLWVTTVVLISSGSFGPRADTLQIQ